jgi:hypothetical protein
MINKNKRGQLTIFIIIAILIVGIIAVFAIPQVREIIIPTAPGDLVPKSCVEKIVKENLNLAMEHGGKVNPTLYFRYNNQTVNYLCYTSEWYKTCSMQTPFLKQTIQEEVNIVSKQKIADCITQMENQLKSRGYNVEISGSKNGNVEIKPGIVEVGFNFTMTLQKGDAPSQTLPSAKFKTEFSSGSYDLIMISSSILNYEARYGDSYPEAFMGFYPNLKVEKKKQEDGTKVYIITDRDTQEKIIFATRSLTWPPGYAIQTG